MELCQEILAKILSKEEIVVTFPDLKLNASELLEMTCYQALCRIRDILRDDSFSDVACFYKIEKILCLLEDLGSNAGFRHD